MIYDTKKIEFESNWNNYNSSTSEVSRSLSSLDRFAKGIKYCFNTIYFPMNYERWLKSLVLLFFASLTMDVAPEPNIDWIEYCSIFQYCTNDKLDRSLSILVVTSHTNYSLWYVSNIIYYIDWQ